MQENGRQWLKISRSILRRPQVATGGVSVAGLATVRENTSRCIAWAHGVTKDFRKRQSQRTGPFVLSECQIQQILKRLVNQIVGDILKQGKVGR